MILTFTIKEKFNDYNMATYFGDRSNLSCDKDTSNLLTTLEIFSLKK